MSRFERLARSPFLLPALLALGAVIAVARGQDAAWDLKNYHLYNAWAFLHGRLGWDVAAASLQGYFNPLLDLPYFWLGSGPLSDFPRLLAAWQGLAYGGLLYVLVRIALRLEAAEGRPFNWMAVTAVVIGATGTMTLTQAGTSTNEVTLALLVLGGFLAVMPVVTGQIDRPWGRAVVAGLLCGLAAGLKPTAIVYAPALAAALLVALRFQRQAWAIAAVFVLASVCAFAAAYGPWGWQVWKLTGNPVFPMFNQIFQSPWMPATSGTDKQFMPRSVSQALFYPFWWLHKNRTQGGNTFADARYAIAMVALLGALAVAHLARRGNGQTDRAAARLLFTFVAVGYGLWLALYSILRYAVPIEALTGLVILSATHGAAWRLRGDMGAAKATGVVMAAVLVVVLATTRYTDWGHAPFGPKAFAIEAGSVEPGSVVAILSGPTAYVAPFVGNADRAKFVGVTSLNVLGGDFELGARARAAIAGQQGPVYALLRDDSGSAVDLFLAYVPGATFGACRRVTSQIEQTRRRRDISEGLRICRVERVATPTG